MGLTKYAENSATISTTEWSLARNQNYAVVSGITTASGIFQVFLDLSNLAAGDQFELKCYEIVQENGTQRLVDSWEFVATQARPHTVIPSLLLMYGWDFTLKRIAGSDRTIAWSIRYVT